VRTHRRCTHFEQDECSVTLHFQQVGDGQTLAPVRRRLLEAHDEVNSAIRQQLFPQNAVCFADINTWRGVILHNPMLTG
jgi:2-polyprenyl-6-methoxyphenol hydroxylase-like FAD-dependent oxidoreductase